MHLKDVKPAENMYPVIAHPEQEKAARDNLAALEGRMGKKPKIPCGNPRPRSTLALSSVSRRPRLTSSSPSPRYRVSYLDARFLDSDVCEVG
jgi:hypothetical protein